MDHSIRMALDMAETVISNSDLKAWRKHVMENRDL
jgi:hypothetical protein